MILFAWLRYKEVRGFRLPIHPKLLIDNGRTLFVRLAPFVALAWLLVALARPVVQNESVEQVSGLETLYLAIDASRSMQGVDRKPNRFEFAKKIIETLIEKDKHHKFALIAFTTNALILSPPTEDSALIRAALESFNPDFILTHGTSLQLLLETMAKLTGEKKELVIFSDGGDNEDLSSLLGLAKKNNIRLYGVACATKEGSKIPYEGGWLRDESGRLVVSNLNPQLERLSLETGGTFIDEESPSDAAKEIMESVATDALVSENRSIRYRELFWIPLTLGLLFYLYATLSMGALKRALTAALLLFGLNAEAGFWDIWQLNRGYEAYHERRYDEAKEIFSSIKPPLLESTYALASAYYRLGAYKKAGRLYLRCKSSDPAVKRRIWHNLGNCAMKMGRYKSAKTYYVKALQLGYDADTAANLQKALFLEEQRQKRIEVKANKTVKAPSSSGSSDQTKESEQKKRSRSQAKMGEGSGSSTAAKSTRIKKERASTEAAERHPLGSRAYEMINKGYVHEKRPW